jgi:hypothetical protein
MSCDKFSRMIIKRGTGKATIPVSSDHRNGDWIATDVYDGEWYQNITDGQMYIRNDRDILAVGDPVILQQKLTVKQTGTGAPVITFLSNTFNGAGTIVWTRLAAGEYEGTLSGVFTADKTFLNIEDSKNADEQTRIYRKTTSKIEIRTFKGGSPTDGILNENSVLLEIYP